MIKQFYIAFTLGCSALLLASCTAKNEPKVDPPAKTNIVEAPPAPADPREVTLHIDGMAERLKLI